MATVTTPMPTELPQAEPAAEAPAAEVALIPSTAQEAMPDEFSPESPVNRMLVEVDVAVPVRNFRVRNLLALEQGAVIESQWKHEDDLPLSAPGVQLAWTEFDVVETQLAVRLTRLA
jgi:flagellar motor switch/type III secretory pathway protein FliN